MTLNVKTVQQYVAVIVPVHARGHPPQTDVQIAAVHARGLALVVVKVVLLIQGVPVARQPVPIPVKANALPHVQVIAKAIARVNVNQHVQASVKVNAVKHAQKLVPTIVVKDVVMGARQVVLHRAQEVVLMIVRAIALVPVQIVATAAAIMAVQDLVLTTANILVRQPAQMIVPGLVGEDANNTVKHIVLIHVLEALGRRK